MAYRSLESVAQVGLEVEEVGAFFAEFLRFKLSNHKDLNPACFWLESSDACNVICVAFNEKSSMTLRSWTIFNVMISEY